MIYYNESTPMIDKHESASDPLHLGSRLGTLEQEVSGLKTDIGYIRNQIGEISQNFNQFVGQGRTNWTALATWGAVIVAILVAYSKLSTVQYDNYIALNEKREYHQELLYQKNQDVQAEVCKMLARHDERLIALRETVQHNYELDTANHADSVTNFREIKNAMFDQTHRWTRQDHIEYSRLIEKQIESLYNIVHKRVVNENPKFCPSTSAN